MFIDCHVHAVEEAPCPRASDGLQPVSTPEQLIEIYDQHDIEQAVILPIGSPDSTNFVQSNEEVLRMAKRHPGRFIPFCNLDARSMLNHPGANLEYVLKYYRDKGCKGIGEVTVNLPIDDPRVENLFAAAESAGLALTFHLAIRIGRIYGLEVDKGLGKLEKALQKFPNLKFFAHSQTFWAEMDANVTEAERGGYPKGKITEEGAVPKLMRKYPNLYGDMSAGSGCNALARDEEYAVKFLNEFQDRLMFGTDICAPEQADPCLNLTRLLKKFRAENRISEEVFRKVARENIIRILEL
ncbi:MAG: hypothetical protein E7039_06675 [Lentisphaerae bacterium]|nr:hypothetical protein [Lentisphaerota bacterium]